MAGELAKAAEAVGQWLRSYCDQVCQYGPMRERL